MLIRKMLFASLFLCSAMVMTALGQKNKDTPVATMIEGFGVDRLPTLRIQSDQAGQYKNSGAVVSHLQSYGDWELVTTGSTRTVLFDFREPVEGTTPTAPFTYGQIQARFICKCTQNNGFDMRYMSLNEIGYCPLFPSFQFNGDQYRIDMDGVNSSIGTDRAKVTCLGTSSSTNQCIQWKIEPSRDYGGETKNVGRLLKVVSKPKHVETDMGSYYFSFTIDVTNP